MSNTNDTSRADEFDAFLETYKPILNSIDANASFDGLAFETYGDELKFVIDQPDDHVVTLVEGDDGGTYLTAGFHVVNRLNYMITTVPVPRDLDVLVCAADEVENDLSLEI